MPRLLWHGTSVYNGHLWGRVILAPVSKRLVVELSLPVFLRIRSVAANIRTLNLPLAGRTFLHSTPPPRLHLLDLYPELKVLIYLLTIIPLSLTRFCGFSLTNAYSTPLRTIFLTSQKWRIFFLNPQGMFTFRHVPSRALGSYAPGIDTR